MFITICSQHQKNDTAKTSKWSLSVAVPDLAGGVLGPRRGGKPHRIFRWGM